MEIKSTAKPTPAFKLLAFVTMRNAKNREAAIKDKFFVIKEDCENTYSSGMVSIIPAGTTIQAEFGGDFGLYAIADIDGVLRKVKIELHEWHKIDFGEIPDDVVEQAEKTLNNIRESDKHHYEEDY